jgi:hypothetical protein
MKKAAIKECRPVWFKLAGGSQKWLLKRMRSGIVAFHPIRVSSLDELVTRLRGLDNRG